MSLTLKGNCYTKTVCLLTMDYTSREPPPEQKSQKTLHPALVQLTGMHLVGGHGRTSGGGKFMLSIGRVGILIYLKPCHAYSIKHSLICVLKRVCYNEPLIY